MRRRRERLNYLIWLKVRKNEKFSIGKKREREKYKMRNAAFWAIINVKINNSNNKLGLVVGEMRWNEMKWDELKMRLPYNITIKVVIIKKTQILRTYYIISHFIFHGFFSLKITRYIYTIATHSSQSSSSSSSFSHLYLAAQGTLLYWQVLFYFLHFFLVVVVFFSFNANQSLSSFNSNKKRRNCENFSSSISSSSL